jgi:hypothetical protein
MILSSLASLAHARTHNNAFCCVFANSYKKNSKRRSSGHVESDSTWRDDCQILIRSTSAAYGMVPWLGIDDKIASVGGDDY